jgi:molybdopterin synthase catalytic subunit
MLDAMQSVRYDILVRVNVRYFAVVRERLGLEAETIEVPHASTVAIALDTLARRYDAIGQLRKHLRVAVNQEMVPLDHPLSEGDEVALIPPVAGGVERLARVIEDRAPSVDAVIAAVRGPEMGGIVAFVGLVRRHSQGREVARLEYEAYAEMAEKVFRELCAEIEGELPGVRLAVEHRVGMLAIGDVAVAIAAAAPHRGEAFRACQAMIDRLKERAPIWKRETGPDGTEWVGMGP